MDILQMPGEVPGFASLHIFPGHVKGNMGGIGLGGSGHQHRRISQGDPGFRHAQLQGHFHAGVDNGNDLKTVSIKKGEPFNLIDADFLVPSLETKGYRPKKTEELYSDADAEKDEITLKFIPYFAFANRGTSEMLVWILRDYL